MVLHSSGLDLSLSTFIFGNKSLLIIHLANIPYTFPRCFMFRFDQPLHEPFKLSIQLPTYKEILKICSWFDAPSTMSVADVRFDRRCNQTGVKTYRYGTSTLNVRFMQLINWPRFGRSFLWPQIVQSYAQQTLLVSFLYPLQSDWVHIVRI